MSKRAPIIITYLHAEKLCLFLSVVLYSSTGRFNLDLPGAAAIKRRS